MAHFPLFIDLNEKNCLVIGGGSVAARKANVLAASGAVVELISRSFCDEAKTLANCKLTQEEVSISMLKKKQWKELFIVVAATDDETLNHEISCWCQEQGIYINSATNKEDSTFIFPAVVMKEGITLGITSEGKSPAVTRMIRTRVEQCIPDQLEDRLEELEAVREIVKDKVEEQSLRKEIFYELMRIGLEEQKEITQTVTNQVIDKVMREYENND